MAGRGTRRADKWPFVVSCTTGARAVVVAAALCINGMLVTVVTVPLAPNDAMVGATGRTFEGTGTEAAPAADTLAAICGTRRAFEAVLILLSSRAVSVREGANTGGAAEISSIAAASGDAFSTKPATDWVVDSTAVDSATSLEINSTKTATVGAILDCTTARAAVTGVVVVATAAAASGSNEMLF